MTKPIQAGDLCQVIDGLMGQDSPNIGLIVTVVAFVGEHSQHGRIWRCKAKTAKLGQPGVNAPPGHADFAQAWLKKIKPPATRTKVTKEDEVTA